MKRRCLLVILICILCRPSLAEYSEKFGFNFKNGSVGSYWRYKVQNGNKSFVRERKLVRIDHDKDGSSHYFGIRQKLV